MMTWEEYQALLRSIRWDRAEQLSEVDFVRVVQWLQFHEPWLRPSDFFMPPPSRPRAVTFK